MFYRYWWEHLTELEKDPLTDFSLMKNMDSYFKKHSFVRQIPVLTLSIFTSITFAVLFAVLPLLIYMKFNIPYLLMLAIVLIVLLFSDVYFKRERWGKESSWLAKNLWL